MGSSVTTIIHKSKDEAKTSKIIGVVFIVVTTLICYIIGCAISQSDSFYDKTGINLNLKIFGVKYFIQMISLIVPIIFYLVTFDKYYSTKDPEYSFTKTDSGKPYIYSGWTLSAVITGILPVAVAFVIYLIAFKGTMVLIKPLLLWVWLLQGIFSALTLFIPAFKPLKNR